MSSTKRVPWILLSIAFVILTDLSYSNVLGQYTGLDPSWANGITRAAELHFAFGRDIIFTYGPLGYLTAGVTFPDSYRDIVLARICIALIFSVSVVYFSAKLPLRHFLLTITTIAFASFLVRIDQATACIGAMAALSMLLLDRRSKFQSHEAVAIGVLAGLAILSKFTLGVQFLGTVGTLLFINAGRETFLGISKSPARCSLSAFLLAMAATMSATLDAPNMSPSACRLLWFLCIVSIVVANYFRPRVSKLSAAALTISAIIVFILVAMGDTKDFLTTSLQISLGYSDAMNIVATPNPTAELAMGILLEVLLILIAVAQRSVLSNGAIAGLLIFGWLNFKEGYVREGPGHIIAYLIPMILLFAIMVGKAKSRRNVALSMLAFAAAYFSLSAKIVGSPIKNYYTLSSILALSAEYGLAFESKATAGQHATAFEADLFDDGSTARLQSLPVDVQPWETTVVFANDLRWKPEPVFQSVSAYTPALDNLNAQSLSARDRRVLVDFTAIDGRNFMAESPQARRSLLCNYQLDPRFGQRLAHVKSGEQFAVMFPTHSNKCLSISKEEIGPLEWGRAYPLPKSSNGTLTFLALALPYSLRGKITKTLFRGPEVTIEIYDRTGRSVRSRVLPENVVNGFLINPNPTNTREFARLFTGDLEASSIAFSIDTNEPAMFRRDLVATFEKVAISIPKRDHG